MNPEREAEIRRESTVRADDCGQYARELLAALDAERAAVIHLKRELVAARAERDELRAKVKALNVYLTKSHEWWSGASAKADGFRAAIIKGRELGLWEE